MENNEEQIEEMIRAVKTNGDLSVWKKNRKTIGFVNLLSEISNLPKTQIPRFDSDRVRGQILDRISIPVMADEKSGWMGKLSAFAPYIKIGVGVMATLLIVVSLTLATAVTALNSVPGSTVYPLKKIVENIELKLTPNDQQANLQLKFADNRAEELQQVLQNNQDGKISDQETQAIVASTVKDLQQTASAAVTANKTQSKSTASAAIVTKLADISNKLKAASIQSEGEVKIELEQAIQSTQTNQQQAIQNLEQAGLKVDGSPISTDTPGSSDTSTDNSVTASGKLDTVSDTSVSIGTAKFLLTNDTKFVGLVAKDLKVGIAVDIQGTIKDNKTYAVQITLATEPPTNTQPAATDTNTDSQPAK